MHPLRFSVMGGFVIMLFKSNTLGDSSNKQFLYHVASSLRKINMKCIFSNTNNEAKFIEHIVPELTNVTRIENEEIKLIKLVCSTRKCQR